MGLAIVLQARILAFVALRTSWLFTNIFPTLLMLVATMLQTPVACKTSLRVCTLETGTAATLRAV